MKQKIGIMTFWRINNYGAVLQAYGLSTTLARLGFEAEIIDYQCEFLEKPYRWNNLLAKGIINYFASLFGFWVRVPRNAKFNAFRKQYLKTSPRTYNKYTLADCSYDTIIVGSDQVWNLAATGMDTGYLLDSIPESVNKYSYAASFGISKEKKEWVEPVKKYLGQFKRLTVREEAGKKIITDILPNTNCEVMIDPVFLIKKSEWLKMAVIPKCKNYILVYQQSVTPIIVNIAKKIAAEKKMKIIFIPFPIGAFAAGKYKTNYSPEEWLGLIRNAAYVITDSFHGVAFSIIMNKNFFVSVSGVSQKTGGRIWELLEKVNLQERYITSLKELDICKDELGYEDINRKIEEEREKALAYLRELENK